MKLNRILILTLTLAAAFAVPATTFAAKGAKAAKGEGKAARPGKALKEIDKNSNKQIDGDEIEALKKQFEAEPKGALANLDRDKDGKLGDKEIEGLNKRMAKQGEGKAGGKKKKKTV